MQINKETNDHNFDYFSAAQFSTNNFFVINRGKKLKMILEGKITLLRG